MLQPFNPAIAANRFGLGARPRELTVIGADGRDWLLCAAHHGAAARRRRAASLRGHPRAGSGAAAADPGGAAQRLAGQCNRERRRDRGGIQKLPQYLQPIYVSEVTARLGAAASSERPFAERLVQFWSNHFAVSVDKQYLAGLAGSFEREAIRPHVFGSFNDLLLGVETHPAMLLYLDNQQSVGAHSEVALRVQRRGGLRRLGINENLAREILELHTLGVGGGYTQADVTTFAQVITGWSIGGTGGRSAGGADGRFEFRADVHEPGAKVVLGRRYPDAGFGQGVTVLRDLAHHRSTAHFIATKLTRHFIADEPPARPLSDSPSSCRPAAICRAYIARSSIRAKHGSSHSRSTKAPSTTSSPHIAGSPCRWTRAVRRSRRLSFWGKEPGNPGRRRAGRTAAPTGTARRRS